MRLSMLLVACATAQAQVHTVKYPTLPAATDFQAASATCPVRCKWDGERLRVEHMVKHGKMVAWVPSQTPGAHVNKVFHKCYHDAVTAECKCGCAQWDGDCDVGGRQCPTGCGHEASEFAGNLAENANLKCYYGSDELPDSHCYAPDRNGACAVDCPATVACPTKAPTPYPTPAPTPPPTPKPYAFNNGNLGTALKLLCSSDQGEQEARARYGDIGTWNTKGVTSLKWTLVNLKCNHRLAGIGNWDVSNVVTFEGTFAASDLNQDISGWDVSKGEDFSWCFSGSSFNQDISGWDMSKTKSLMGMFQSSSFNQPIGDWDVSRVTNFNEVFLRAREFNQPIGNWDTSSGTSFYGVFDNCATFNQPIGNWDVSKSKTFYDMFNGAASFNQPIGNWDVSQSTSFVGMFKNTKTFNQPIGNWDVSNGLVWHGMLNGAEAFNQNLNNWKVTCDNTRKLSQNRNLPGCPHQCGFVVKASQYSKTCAQYSKGNSMYANSVISESNKPIPPPYAFNNGNLKTALKLWCSSDQGEQEARAKYGDIGRWDTKGVTTLAGYFRLGKCNHRLAGVGNWDVSNVKSFYLMARVSDFNQPIGGWDMSSAESLNGMFHTSSFNQPVGDWDVSRVTDFNRVFMSTPFNQPIGNWDTSSGTDFYGTFYGAASFNQPIGNWDVSKGKVFRYMFDGAASFNQPIGNWDVSQSTNFMAMFSNTKKFNQPIGNWDVSNGRVWSKMFNGAEAFNQNLNNWKVTCDETGGYPTCAWYSRTYGRMFANNGVISESNKPNQLSPLA